jgi:hypothetical protein
MKPDVGGKENRKFTKIELKKFQDMQPITDTFLTYVRSDSAWMIGKWLY